MKGHPPQGCAVYYLSTPTLPTLSEALYTLIAEETHLRDYCCKFTFVSAISARCSSRLFKLQPQPRLLAATVAGQIILMCGVSRSTHTSWLKWKLSVLPRSMGQLQLLLTAFKQQLRSTRTPAIAAYPLLHSVDTCQPAPCLLHHTQILLVGCWIVELVFTWLPIPLIWILVILSLILEVFKQLMVTFAQLLIRAILLPLCLLSDVSLVPKLSMNLIYVDQLADLNCVIGFDDTSCFI